MKDLIKQLLRESLITERLTDIDSDVDMLYDKYFRETIERIQSTLSVSRDMFRASQTNTSKLHTPEAISANELNPCTIMINGKNSNVYNPSMKFISIGFNPNAINYVIDEYNGNLKQAIYELEPDSANSLKREFTEERVKGSIHHELAHWLDDTMNNKHLSKTVAKARERGTRDINGKPIDASKIEIQGQIHNVKQLYNKYKDNWDEITFNQMISQSPSLNHIYNSFSGDVKKQWVRDLKTRMHREGLLGKNMVNN